MPTLGLFITLGTFALYCLYGCVLAYHWVRYGASFRIIFLSFGTYAVSGFYLLFAMLAATISFS